MIQIQTNQQQETLIRDFASQHHMDVSDMLVQTILERIEDELDLQAYEAAKQEFDANPITYSHEDVKKMLELD